MSTIKAWLRTYGRGTFLSWDFFVAIVCGAAAAGMTSVRVVRESAVTILIAEAAVGVALMAVVFAGMAIFATFYDSTYRRVLDLAGGFRSAMMPYITVSVVSALSGGVGILGAFALPSLGDWTGDLVCGASTLLFAWSVTGVVSITGLTLFHAGERAKLMRGADEAENIRAQRLRSPRAS